MNKNIQLFLRYNFLYKIFQQYYLEGRQTSLTPVATPVIEEHPISDAEVTNSDAGMCLFIDLNM